jgi:hypothetical protein
MKTRLVCLVFILAAATAYAQPSLQDLQPFVGTFNCTGLALASEMGPEHATRGTVTSKWVLDKKWLEVRYNETKTTKNPHPFLVVAHWGYDAQTKKIVALSADGFGGYGTEDSPGWDGDQLVFTGAAHMGSMTMQGRDTFTRKGKNELGHFGEIQDQSGGWKKTDEETCKR